jgi:hypothetical protein
MSMFLDSVTLACAEPTRQRPPHRSSGRHRRGRRGAIERSRGGRRPDTRRCYLVASFLWRRFMPDNRTDSAANDGDELQLLEADAAALPDASEPDSARHVRIAVAAYLRAESRGFEPGRELDDWLEAEREVAREGRRIAA